MKTLDQLFPYIVASIIILAMLNLFLAFSKYVERHGL